MFIRKCLKTKAFADILFPLIDAKVSALNT